MVEKITSAGDLNLQPWCPGPMSKRPSHTSGASSGSFLVPSSFFALPTGLQSEECDSDSVTHLLNHSVLNLLLRTWSSYPSIGQRYKRNVVSCRICTSNLWTVDSGLILWATSLRRCSLHLLSLRRDEWDCLPPPSSECPPGGHDAS